MADPKFLSFHAGEDAKNDYRLTDDSPAVKQGIVLPDDLEDPLRPQDGARPDIGAIPLGGEPLRVGIDARIVAGETP